MQPKFLRLQLDKLTTDRTLRLFLILEWKHFAVIDCLKSKMSPNAVFPFLSCFAWCLLHLFLVCVRFGHQICLHPAFSISSHICKHSIGSHTCTHTLLYQNPAVFVLSFIYLFSIYICKSSFGVADFIDIFLNAQQFLFVSP